MNTISRREYYLLLKQLPNTSFKLGTWDCYLLVQHIRSFFNLNLLPKVKYNKPVLDQLNKICTKLETYENFCLVAIKNFEGHICLGTLLQIEHHAPVVLHIDEYVIQSSLTELDILGFYRYE